MPLVRLDLPAGRPPEFRRAVADGVHAALVEAVGIPPDDRFQVLGEHAPGALVADPGYLGIARGPDFTLVQIFLSAGRSDSVKRALYAAIAREVAARGGPAPNDVMVVLTETNRVDWSFGNGLAQYVPGPPG